MDVMRCVAVCRFAVFVVAGVALGGCKRAPAGYPAGNAAPPVQVRLGPVVRMPVDRSIAVTGTLFGREEATLSAKVGGRVTEVRLDVDDAVKSGDVVIQIDRAEYELAVAERRAALRAVLAKLGITEMPGPGFDATSVPTVERAKAEAANARARLGRAQSLIEQVPPVISEQEYADVSTEAEVARRSAEVEVLLANTTLAEAQAQAAVIASAEQRLADTAIRAPVLPSGEPISYRVAERLVSLGEMVAVGQPVARIVATDVLKFRGRIPEKYAAHIEKGQRATVTTDASPELFPGTVERVAPRIDQRSRTFEVEIHIANPDGAIKPGGFAGAEIVTLREDAVSHVPKSAVRSFAGVHRVFSIKDGKAVEHVITIGDERDGLVEIVGGLQAAEVVVTGVGSLANGNPVAVSGDR